MIKIPWEADFPSPLLGTQDEGRAGGGVPVYSPGKTRFWITDTPPGGSSPVHRTISLDYGKPYDSHKKQQYRLPHSVQLSVFKGR